VTLFRYARTGAMQERQHANFVTHLPPMRMAWRGGNVREYGD
jgi:hypothetical protein